MMQRIGTSGGNVIEMAGFLGDTRFPALAEVEAYWEGLRRNGEVPRRSDIDPRGIENALEYAFILERIAPGLARMRIAGMHLSELMGMEVRGMPISSFIAPAGRDSFSETLETVMDQPAVARLTLSAETGIGKPPLDGRMLLLPLQSDMGDVARVLGCFSTNGPIARAPRRFNVMKTEIRTLEAPRPRVTAPEVPAPGFAEVPRRFEARAKPGQRPSYLRLVQSDD